jgi:hypothetical protein
VDIEEVVLKLLAKEPQARYENGRALMATLDTTDTAHREELSMRPSHFIATRVSIELKNNPLPPIAAQKNASKLSILQPFTALSNQSYMPILVIGGSILVMLLCVTALVVAFLSLQDGDEPSSVSQPITVNLTSSPTATTEATPSLTPAPSPTTPPVLVPLQNGVGLSNGRRLNDGGLQVEGYCNPQYVEGYAAVSHDNEHWYCHRSRGSSDRVQLTQADFDRICQLTYSNSNAIAMQVDGPSIPAFNWKCFGPITP